MPHLLSAAVATDRAFELPKVLQLWQDYQQWRAKEKIDGILESQLVEPAAAAGVCIWGWHGKDRTGECISDWLAAYFIHRVQCIDRADRLGCTRCEAHAGGWGVRAGRPVRYDCMGRVDAEAWWALLGGGDREAGRTAAIRFAARQSEE